MKRFELGQVLSVTTGTLLCDIGKVYEILNYLTGDNLFTHQLPRASRECKPYILKQHPQLKNINTAKVNTENWKGWLGNQEKKYGKYLELKPIPTFRHKVRNPIDELVEMVGEEKVIVIAC